MPKFRFRDYQKIGYDYCLKVIHPALFCDMRLGKNIVVIRACKRWECKLNLIVAPYETFNSWIEELKSERENDFQIIEGTRTTRMKKLNILHKWNLLNIEGWQVIPEIKNISWNSLIFDESYRLHNPKSKISKFFIRNFRIVDHRFVLSGLADPEDRLNYFMQMQFVNPECFQSKSYWDFRVKHCRPSYYKWVLTKKGKDYMVNRLAQYAYIVSKKDTKLYGEKVCKTRFVKQTPSFFNIQKLLKEEFVLEVKGKELKSTVYAPNAFTLLHQLCGGFADGEFIFKNKLRVLKNYIINNLQNEQFVICAWYRPEIKLLCNELTKMNIKTGVIFGDVKPKERREVEKGFKNKKYQAMILNPGCYRYGANISMIDTMLIYSSPSSLEKRRQIEDRIIDVDQIESSYIIEFIVENSVDVDISESIKNKENKSNLMKRIIKRCSQN